MRSLKFCVFWAYPRPSYTGVWVRIHIPYFLTFHFTSNSRPGAACGRYLSFGGARPADRQNELPSVAVSPEHACTPPDKKG